jgi:hypothetical protein
VYLSRIIGFGSSIRSAVSGKIFTLPSLFAKVLELDYNIPAEALHGGQ